MSIVNKIESISNHLTDAYNSLEALGINLNGVNKNIENLSMILDDVYDSMPQASGEGTSLSLNDTRVGKIKSTLKGNTSQSDTPTLTNPIPINVVSGDNEIVIEGKNLLGYPTTFEETRNGINVTQNKGVYVTSGTTTSSGNFMFDKELNNRHTIQTGDYLHVGNSVVNSNCAIVLVFSDNTNESVGLISVNRVYNLANKVGKTIIALRLYCNATNISINMQVKPMIINNVSTSIDFIEYQGNTYNIDLPVENLFNKNNYNGINSYFNDNTPQLSSTANSYKSVYISCKPNTTYTMSKISSARYSVGYTNETPAVGVTVNGTITNNSATTITITTGANAQYLIAFIYHASYDTTITLQDILNSIQIETSSKANTYTPFGTTPIELCKIGDYQDYFAKSDGSNLLSLGTQLNGYRDTSTGEFREVSNNSIGYWFKTSDLPNTITINCVSGNRSNVSYYNSIPAQGVVSQSYSNSTSLPRTITIDKNYPYVHIQFSYLQDVTNIMVNEGSNALPYQPYGVGKWYLYKEIGKVVLNGSETIDIYNQNTNRTNFQVINILSGVESYTSAGDMPRLLSNRFIPNTQSATWVVGNMSRRNVEGVNEYLYLTYEPSTTIEAFKTWLGTNNIPVYYVYATPINTEITYQPLIDQLNLLEKAMSKDGQTNISQANNDLPFIIRASALTKNSD